MQLDNKLEYLSADIICSEKPELRSRKTVSLEAQIWRQMEAIVLISFKMFFAKRPFLEIGNITPIIPTFCRGKSSVMRLKGVSF